MNLFCLNFFLCVCFICFTFEVNFNVCDVTSNASLKRDKRSRWIEVVIAAVFSLALEQIFTKLFLKVIVDARPAFVHISRDVLRTQLLGYSITFMRPTLL